MVVYNDTVASRWRWEDLCGPGGLKIWSGATRDLGLCFQEFCLFVPVLCALATASSYFYAREISFVVRPKSHVTIIKFRCFIVGLLAACPILLVYINLDRPDGNKYPIFYFLSTVQCLTWFIHLGYVNVLKKRLGLSARGPLIICFLWTIVAVLSVINLRSHVLLYNASEIPDFNLSMSYIYSVTVVVLQVLYGLTLLPSESGTVYEAARHWSFPGESQPILGSAYYRFVEEHDPNYLGVAMEDTNWFSRLLFYWVNPLMQKGVDGKLTGPDDLFDVPDSLRSDILSRNLEWALVKGTDDAEILPEQNEVHDGSPLTADGVDPRVSYQVPFRQGASLLRALHRCFWFQFYSIGALKFIADSSGFAGPLLLKVLIELIENKSEDVHMGYIYAFGFFATTLITAFCTSHFNFLMAIVGLKIRASLITTIYRKTLLVSSTTLSSAFSTGEIVNFMSTDTDRVVNACPSFHALWSIPFQIAVTLYLLYRQVGLAFLAGLGFTIILIPINKAIANKIGELSGKMMREKDQRVKVMTEILRGIKSIRLHVWEDHFVRVITKFRDLELKYLKSRKYLDALCVYFWATTPVIVAILTFVTYILLGNQLTASVVFTSIALLNMLIAPLNAFPWVLNGITEAWVSICRIQKLLDLPDLDLYSYYEEEVTDENSNTDVIIQDGEFCWGKVLSDEEVKKLHAISRRPVKDKGKGKKSKTVVFADSPDTYEAGNSREFSLTGINLNIKKGDFVGIIGPVGSGKSSIFYSILAELSKQRGKVSVSNIESGFALVTQQPWLQRGTIRDNILFGRAYDENKYNKVLSACCLIEDLFLLPAGDLTGVGEGGMTLSGGQKARIALARAVYQDKQIFLLDDIMSAVDINVAKHIYQNCVMGLLKDKTRVLCTHHVKYLMHANRIILMDNGTLKQQGPPREVLSKIDEMLPINLELESSTQSTYLVESMKIEDSNDSDSVLNEETRDSGTVDFKVYKCYWKAIGHLLSLSILLAISLMQLSRNMTDWWLSRWVSNDQNKTTNWATSTLENGYEVSSYVTSIISSLSTTNIMGSYMTVYILLAVINSVFTLVRAFLFAFGGITAACRVHKSLLKIVITAKMTFFDVTPIGRILNRFSSDTYTVDDSLPFILNILLAQLFGLIGSIVITTYGLPWLCLVIVPLIPIYHWLQNNYRLTSRELKRLSSVTLSPIYNHFTETLQGSVVIRAFRTTQRFIRDNDDNVEVNQKTQLASYAAAQWLGLRLQFIGVAMITGVVLIAVVQHQYDIADPGYIGLAITYALSITGLLSGLVNAFTETEREMIAVERVVQYIEDIVPETTHFVVDPPYAWPSQGVISFNNVVFSYRDHLAPSLKGVTFETRPAEKIGVVGRTGAGKTSLLASLFRIGEITSGSITIDSVNVAHISIRALRSRLYCIPQEPFLYSGTMRENLDPLNEFTDPELWSALDRVGMTPALKHCTGGLYCEVASGGSNFSVGQKQLVCLARALLHNAKILCIDEATASIDQETDHQIQCILRSAFRKSTVITVAHRVQTILDSDRVLVMGEGNVLEFNNPDVLLNDSSSYFYQLVNDK